MCATKKIYVLCSPATHDTSAGHISLRETRFSRYVCTLNHVPLIFRKKISLAWQEITLVFWGMGKGRLKCHNRDIRFNSGVLSRNDQFYWNLTRFVPVKIKLAPEPRSAWFRLLNPHPTLHPNVTSLLEPY